MLTARQSRPTGLVVRYRVYDRAAVIRPRYITVEQAAEQLAAFHVSLIVSVPLKIVTERFDAGIAAGHFKIEVRVTIAVGREPHPHSARRTCRIAILAIFS